MKLIKRLRIFLLIVFIFLGTFMLVGCENLLGVINPHEHVLVEHEGKEATCDKDGWLPYVTCSKCDWYTTYTKTPALGHDYSGEYKANGDVHSLFCVRCSASVADHPHYWETVSVIEEPTCTMGGTALAECSVCEERRTEEIPKRHGECEWLTYQAATAFDPGSKIFVCTDCYTELETARIPADVESMPIIYLTGEYQNATNAKNEVEMQARYVHPNGDSFDSYATIKVQGSSSVAYDKKNYTIKFFKDEECSSKFKVDLGWGKENKYVMKANWVDFSQARNVVSCRLWGDIVSTRNASENQARLAALKTNAGAIDGFPIAVFMNGEFYGLYTMNVPKDEWMFDMGDSETEALLAADDWNNTDFSVLLDGFAEDSAGDLISNGGGWELVYFGTEDTTGSHQWVTDSFNALISFCQNNDGDAFRAGIRQHLDVDAAIDYVIYMYANCMHDNASKNMLWATYDGKTWIPSVYDQDGTFGQVWDGVRFSAPSSSLPSVKNGRIDVGINYGPSGSNNPKFILWDRIWNCFTEEVLARYTELRASVLSTENMIAELKAFENAIPESLYEADLEVWQASRENWWTVMKKQTGSWDYTKYHYDYMYQWVQDRMEYYDSAIKSISDYYNSN